MLELFIGIPEDDQEVTVPEDWTVVEVLQHYEINTTGLVQLNGNTLRTSDLNKTLSALGVTSGDQLYVVRKLDSA